MKRLTGFNERTGQAYIEGYAGYLPAEVQMAIVQAVVKKCWEYENTGLDPEEVAYFLGTTMSVKEAKAQYLEHKKRHDEYMAWKKAETEGRLFVIPWATDITIDRDGLLYKGDHWNPPTLTAFADDLTTRTGKRVCLFSVEDVKYAEAALRGGADG